VEDDQMKNFSLQYGPGAIEVNVQNQCDSLEPKGFNGSISAGQFKASIEQLLDVSGYDLSRVAVIVAGAGYWACSL